MSNTSQKNSIENINKEISLLQDRVEIKEKSLYQFKNGLRANWKITIKRRTKDKSF